MSAVRVRLKYVTEDVDRYGTVRVYLRRPGFPKIRLRAIPGTPEFMAEYQAALRAEPLPPKPKRGPAVDGSVSALALRYYESPAWKGLDATTRRRRRSLLDSFTEQFGDRPAQAVGRKHVVAIRDKLDMPDHSKDAWLKAIRGLFRYGVDAALLDENPALGIGKVGRTTEGFAAWSDSDVEKYLKFHKSGTVQHLALMLLLYTGQRRSDVVLLGRQHVQKSGGREYLVFTQVKNSARNPSRVEIPIMPPLAEALADAPQDRLTFLATPQGKPYTAAGFGNRFREWCDAAGLKGISAHGLRKAAGRILAESGASEREIMAVLGHQEESSVRVYVASANRRKLASSALDRAAGRLSHK